MDKTPLVSIFSLAYNHESYIRKAIESWLMQKVDFDFEAVIGEDCSTDKTREIVLDYAEKYPDIIRVITSEENVGMRENAIRTRKACRGKYIAFCEGDDYWIDPLKLQKQVDFMESNPDFSICFHDSIVLYEDKSKPPYCFVDKDQKPVSTTEDIIEKYFIPTASMLIRSEQNQQPDWFNKIYNGDWATQLLLSTRGKVRYIDEVMSIYRKNQGGLSGGIGKNIPFVNEKKIELLTYFNDYTKGQYADAIDTKISALKKSTRDFNLRKNNRLVFWMSNPLSTLKKSLKYLSKE